MAGIISIDVILLILLMAAGSKGACIGTAFTAWIFSAVIAALCFASAAEYNTPAGRERW